MTSPGEEKAWEMLEKADPAAVCRNASVSLDEKTCSYLLRSFCADFRVAPGERTIVSLSPSGQPLVEKYGYFFKHSCLWYLAGARDTPLAGRLLKPFDLKGGEMFFRGSHVLPLERLAEKYGGDKAAFVDRGREVCAETLNFGDASLRLLPMPRIPATLILWLADEEFPPRADLLFDASCEKHLPIDMIWSIAMLSVLVMV